MLYPNDNAIRLAATRLQRVSTDYLSDVDRPYVMVESDTLRDVNDVSKWVLDRLDERTDRDMFYIDRLDLFVSKQRSCLGAAVVSLLICISVIWWWVH